MPTGVPLAFNQSEVEKLLVETGRRCCICKNLHQVSIHHIRPQAVGGTDHIDNAIPLCPNCHDQVHAGGALGRQARNYTEGELREHRAFTIRLVQGSIISHAVRPSTPNLLERVCDINQSLTACLLSGIDLARSTSNDQLERFCTAEITGYAEYRGKDLQEVPAETVNIVAHRLVDVYFPLTEQDPLLAPIEPRVYLDHMASHPAEFHHLRLVYPEPMAEIEYQIGRATSNGYIVLNLSEGLLTGNASSRKIRGYMDGETQHRILRQVRNEFARRLLVQTQ